MSDDIEFHLGCRRLNLQFNYCSPLLLILISKNYTIYMRRLRRIILCYHCHQLLSFSHCCWLNWLVCSFHTHFSSLHRGFLFFPPRYYRYHRNSYYYLFLRFSFYIHLISLYQVYKLVSCFTLSYHKYSSLSLYLW